MARLCNRGRRRCGPGERAVFTTGTPQFGQQPAEITCLIVLIQTVISLFSVKGAVLPDE